MRSHHLRPEQEPNCQCTKLVDDFDWYAASRDNSWSIADLTPGSLVDGRVAPVSGGGELPPTIFHLAKSFSKEISTASAYAWPWLRECPSLLVGGQLSCYCHLSALRSDVCQRC
ncbi:hypothetical protein FOZ60_000834 [Perkinsus olseni]|uniref:Uncharacterized protein n=1 Tax=Perkinsus olseni TaxID=32597 RepID=A0A7J6PJS4_PEROL|nr:hypothetical protein FOZ60_000834 [Perkinsus olseni]